MYTKGRWGMTRLTDKQIALLRLYVESGYYADPFMPHRLPGVVEAAIAEVEELREEKDDLKFIIQEKQKEIELLRNELEIVIGHRKELGL